MSSMNFLENGTNELEIVEFKVGEGHFAINVAKVETIVKLQKITKIPSSHNYLKGVTNHRDQVMPVVDLTKVFGFECNRNDEEKRMVVTHFNNKKMIMEVSSVEGILRISWQDIEKPSSIINKSNSTPMVGTITLKDKNEEKCRILLMPDFEKVLAEIDDELNMSTNEQIQGLEGKNILIAEDSPFIIKIIGETLTSAGANVKKFSNGQEVVDFITSSDQKVDCIVTDIEMPRMDGLTLTKTLKSSEKTKDIPIILFSSLINDTLSHQGKSVGANAQVTKPELELLITTIKKVIKVIKE